MGLKAYLTRRIVYSIILILAVITVNFLIFAMMPGDPMQQYVSSLKGNMDAKRYEKLRHDLGLDQPLHERYFMTLVNMLTFNLGEDRVTGDPVFNSMKTPILNTLILMGFAEVISIIVGVLLGVVAAYKRGGVLDTSLTTGSLVTYSVPIFFVGWLVILFFAVQLHWFPSGMTQPPGWIRNPPPDMIAYIVGRLRYIVLPALTLFLFTVGGWILFTRACILETINEDYVLTARAKGLKERTILYKHILKNASLPIITNVALAFAFLVSGAIITETLFSYNGMGLLTWRAIYPVPNLTLLQAIFYISALLVIVANFIADLLYGVIDPRVRYE